MMAPTAQSADRDDATGLVLEPFNDGWNGTRVVKHGIAAAGRVEVVDDALPAVLADEVYRFSVERRSGRSWGSYVMLADAAANDAADDANSAAGEAEEAEEAEEDEEDEEDEAAAHALARRMVRAVWLGGGEQAEQLLRHELPRVHGFAVWTNCGCVGEECAYHLDYAELHRRRTGRLHPPLLASTIHVSPLHQRAEGEGDRGEEPRADTMEGGTFGVHTGGLEHYARFGHHGVLARATPGALEADWADEAWVKVDYRARRAILFDGALPHRATTTRSMPPGLRRVVVGINVFDSSVGEEVSRSPVHSAAYRREMAALTKFTRLAPGESTEGLGPPELRQMVAVDSGLDLAQRCVHCGKLPGAAGGEAGDGDGLPFQHAGRWLCSKRCLKAQRQQTAAARTGGE
jgi:hypothetical protein